MEEIKKVARGIGLVFIDFLNRLYIKVLDTLAATVIKLVIVAVKGA